MSTRLLGFSPLSALALAEFAVRKTGRRARVDIPFPPGQAQVFGRETRIAV
jgi:hypothetical protein